MTGAPGLHLSLWRKALGVVPDDVWDRKDLQTLVLAENDLADISERIGELRGLRMLDLGIGFVAFPTASGTSKV